MKSNIKLTLAGIFVVVASFFAAAIDLPTKTINGKTYHYYVVKKGDTIHSVSSKIDISRADIIAANPAAADFIKAGDVLYFEAAADAAIAKEPAASSRPTVTTTHTVKKGETLYGISRQYDVDPEDIIALNPGTKRGVKAGEVLKIPTSGVIADEVAEEVVEVQPEVKPVIEPVVEPIVEDAVEEEMEEEMEEEAEDSVSDLTSEEIAERSASIAVVLPFMLNSESETRQTQLYTDFYKGLMVAADTLSRSGAPVAINTFDTQGDNARLQQILALPEVSEASAIIVPDNSEQIALIASKIDPTKTKLLNVFNVKDTLYMESTPVVQTNTPQRVMYAKAIEAVKAMYPDFTPVILHNESGRNEKIEFVNQLADEYIKAGIEPIWINHDGTLLAANFEALNVPGARFVIIPTTGNLQEFNKFSHLIKSLRDTAFDSQIAVFGYPDWIAFRGDARDMLHDLNATIYSRYYCDEDSYNAKCLNEAFERWFGKAMIDVVPNHGMLGFDIGNMLIKNLRKNHGNFVTEGDVYSGVQSSFLFDRYGEGGYFNDLIYIIRYIDGGRIKSTTI